MAHFIGEDHPFAAGPCPLCGAQNDTATGLNTDEGPEVGDLCVCVGCASPLVYNSDMTMRAMPAAEFNALPDEAKAELRIAMAVVRQMDRR
jgi:hypothetical protein